MTMRRGRCTNVELCKLATSQRIVEIDESEPFICPRCSTDLAPVTVRKPNPLLRAVQVAAVVVGVAGIGAKVYLDNRPKPPEPLVQAQMPETMAAAPAAAIPAAGLKASPPAPPAPLPTPFLRLAGAAPLARHAAARLAAGYLATIGDTDIHVLPGAAPDTMLVVGQQGGSAEAISISATTTQAGLDAVAKGGADLALSLRALSAGEGANPSTTLGLLASRVVANPALHVASLSRTQLAAIYAGKITNWSDLGAAAGEIHAYASGQAEMAASLLLPDASQASAAKTATDDAAVMDAVAHDPAAIGLVGAGAATELRIVPVGEGAASVAPSETSIATQDYPLVQTATLAGGTSGAAHRFIEYVASASGQIALAAAGLVPAAPKAEPRPATALTPTTVIAPADRFHHFVAGASPLPIVFHFEQSSVALDRGGFHDVERLVAYLRAHNIGGDKLILVGFSDSTGTPVIRETASQKRAAAVSAALARNGIVVTRMAGFGADVPVADDATADGRDRNRRVEVYAEPQA